jgi:hypothetical protein
MQASVGLRHIATGPIHPGGRSLADSICLVSSLTHHNEVAFAENQETLSADLVRIVRVFAVREREREREREGERKVVQVIDMHVRSSRPRLRVVEARPYFPKINDSGTGLERY